MLPTLLSVHSSANAVKGVPATVPRKSAAEINVRFEKLMGKKPVSWLMLMKPF